MLSSTESSFQITRRTIELPVSFEAFTEQLEKKLGRYDLATLRTAKTEEDMKNIVANTVGTYPLGIFSITNHGALLGLIGQSAAKAKQYVIGDPRLAVQMTEHEIRAALHAPVTMLVFEMEGTARVDYFTAKSVFAQFGNDRVDRVAEEIDRKRDKLIEKLVLEISSASAS